MTEVRPISVRDLRLKGLDNFSFNLYYIITHLTEHDGGPSLEYFFQVTFILVQWLAVLCR